jgi:hypothetical protein
MKLKDLKTNTKNPRILKNARFKKLLNKVLCYPNLLSKNKLTYDSSDVNTVLCGNQRLATLNYIVNSISTKNLEDSVKTAQKALGLENELLLNNSIAIFTEIKETKSIPSEWVQDVQELSEDEKQAFILIDNLNDGEWDLELIANKWDIDTGEWGLVSWANSEDEQSDNSKGLEAHEDDYEQPEDDQIKTDIVIGDLFEFNGNDGQYHRLLCGDSTDKETVELLTNGNDIDMVFTDPMYQDSPKEIISIFNILDIDHFVIMATFKQCISFVNDSFFRFRFDLVLNQKVPSSSMNKKVPYYLHKNIIYLTKKDETIFHCDNAIGHFSDKGYYPSVIESAKNTSEVHGLTKNAAGIKLILSGFGFKTSLDLFLGSGSTMVASHQLNKNCYGLEIEPKYCQVVIDRMLKLDESITIKKNGVDYVNEH